MFFAILFMASICPPVCLSICLYPSIHSCIYVSFFLSICLSIYPSISLFVERKQFVDHYLDQLQGGKSTIRSRSERTRDSSGFSTSGKNQSRIRSMDSQWIKEHQNYSRPLDMSGSSRPSSSFNQSTSRDRSRWIPDESGNKENSRWAAESGFTDGPSNSGTGGTGVSSLHESMLRSVAANSTSKWDTQSSGHPDDSLAKNLFPSDRTRAQSSQIRPWTTSQHVTIGDDGIITQKVFNEENPNSSTTTKLLLGDNGIEIVRMHSPLQSEDGFTVGSHQFKSPAASSRLVQSPLHVDQSRISDVLPVKDNNTQQVSFHSTFWFKLRT